MPLPGSQAGSLRPFPTPLAPVSASGATRAPARAPLPAAEPALRQLARTAAWWARLRRSTAGFAVPAVAARAQSRVDAAPQGPVETLRRHLAHPLAASGDDVAAACLEVARELATVGDARTALAFAEAARAAAPQDARAALAAGRLASRTGARRHAVRRLRQAAALARTHGNDGALGEAYGALAGQAGAEGRWREALRYARVSVRVLRQADVPAALLCAALDELAERSRKAGRLEAATHHAAEALRLSLGTPEVPERVRRIAALWMERGLPVRAVALLEKLAARDAAPDDLLRTHLLLARAAAEACTQQGGFEAAPAALVHRYHTARAQVLAHAGTRGDMVSHRAALEELADVAERMGDAETARRARQSMLHPPSGMAM